MTHRFKQLFSPAALAAVMAFTACSQPSAPHTPADLASAPLIPLPVSVTATGSSFALNDKTDIYVQGSNPEVTRIAEFLAGYLNPATGLGIAVKSAETLPASGHIGLMLKPDAALGTEGYELIVTETAITLSAPEPAGLFMGIQTLRQLLPARVEAKSAQQGPWEIATGTIRDFPAYGYRGSMLDVGRHFFGVDDVKRYIDLMALYKFNVLHLGLTNDQGWRIEIKSWPRLATYGGSTEVGGGEGGYYTQEQYKDIVAYAAARHILIIPEIDMPGHTQAALASYPMLNCNGKKPELYTGTDVGFSTFCTSNDSVYIFIDDVIRELAALTPGAYIHI
ncbi:MAG: beta-N-acetylhexosaminidase, partial [Bacteroidetes bacterium]